MTRQKYILKEKLNGQPVQDGLFDGGIGIVMHGQVVIPYSDEHEAALRDDPRFKQYTGPAEPTVTEGATVEGKAATVATAETKTPARGKEK